jgi:homoserine O-succinyltransferase
MRRQPTRALRAFRRADDRAVHVALVNNMPDAALEATERQFGRLLRAAAGGIPLRLSLFALPEVPRSGEARRRIDHLYSPINALWETHLDGLIVTGTEPLAPTLKDEPYWESLARLIDWAEYHTHSSIWSCLAAHAAVLHMDGIDRQRRGGKLFGVFESTVSDHFLTAGAAARLRMPHSRWNGLPVEALTAGGYRVLTQSESTGADTFVKQRHSLFVFFQGHPEYEAATLLREYRRDIRRFLKGQVESYPSLPHGYFGEDTVSVLNAMRSEALAQPSEDWLAAFPWESLTAKVRNTWRPAAVTMYHNWLHYLSGRKEQRLDARSTAEAALAESA